MKHMKFNFIVILILCSSSILFAQNSFEISGKILDAKTKKGIPYVNVLLKPIDKGGASKEDGSFVIENLPEGKYKLMVSHIGYQMLEKEIEVKKGAELKFQIELIPKAIEIPVIGFTAPKKVPYSHITSEITKLELNQSPNRDIGEYMRTLPNVNSVRKGGSSLDPAIRGFKYFQVTTFVDEGIMIPGGCPNRMDPTAAHIEVDDIEKVEVVKGPYALKYGVGFGGYVHFITSKPEPFDSKKFDYKIKGMKSFESNYNGSKDYINLKAGNNKIYFNFSAANADYGNYKDGNGEVVPSQYHKYGFSTEVGFKPTMKQEILVSYNQSHNRDGYYPALPMDERIDNTDLFSINYKMMKVSKRIMAIKAKYFRAAVYHEMDNKEREFADSVVSVSRVDALTTGMGAGMMIKTGEKSTLMIGSGLMTMEKFGERTKTYIGQPPSATGVNEKVEVLMDATIRNEGTFFEYKNTFGKMNFVAAGRLDLNFAQSTSPITLADNNGDSLIGWDKSSFYPNVSLSVGIDKPLTEKLSFGAAIGRGVRSPNMIERYMQFLAVGFDNFDYLGNPSVKPEANHQIDVSLIHTSDNLGEITLTGFYAVVTNYITAEVLPPSVVLPNSSDVLGVKFFVNTDLALLRGFELVYRTPQKYSLDALLTASYTKGTFPEGLGYTVGSNGLPSGNQIIEDDPMPEIPPFEAMLTLRYRMLENKLMPKANIRFVADQNYISEAVNERATPGFIVADASIYYKYNNIIQINAGVNNLFDKAYFEHLNRRIIGENGCETCRAGNLYEPGRSFFVNLNVAIE